MLFPQATWSGPLPTTNYLPGGMEQIIGLVLHIEEGTEPGTDTWFHTSGTQVSAHFGNPKAGPLQQWVDTQDMAYAEVNGNPNWISVEHEGNSGDSLTPSQIENDAQLLAWLVQSYGITPQITNDPTIGGVAGHVTGGAAWGDHLECLPLDTTEFLAKDGWLPLRDAKVGMKVAGYNLDQARWQLTEVEYVVPPYLADLVWCGGLEMTEEHSVYVWERAHGKHARIMPAWEAVKLRANAFFPYVAPSHDAGVPSRTRWKQTPRRYKTPDLRSQVPVSCLTTKTGTFVARQNGIPMMVGNCPGPPIMAQRQQIIDRTLEILNPPPQIKENPLKIVCKLLTPSGNGAYYIGSDGSVFAVGDAVYRGSIGQLNPGLPAGGSNAATLDRPIASACLSPSGDGYSLVGEDGGDFNFGDAKEVGNVYTALGGHPNPFAPATVPA